MATLTRRTRGRQIAKTLAFGGHHGMGATRDGVRLDFGSLSEVSDGYDYKVELSNAELLRLMLQVRGDLLRKRLTPEEFATWVRLNKQVFSDESVSAIVETK